MSTTDNTCVVCFKNVDIYSIGVCDHPVCYECSTRMRVLCRQNECPICRQEMPKVIFTKNVRPFKDLTCKTFPSDKEFKIHFDGGTAQSSFEKLLKHECLTCGDNKTFQIFQLLKDHMRKKHELFYCDLCVDNLKIFSHERRVYTRSELAHHRRKGDVDDKSHKGHPLCQFCDLRYMDNDELFRHLRKDHLYCHFCDADGLHQYYSSYDFLREHFRKDHYLCEEGTCYEEQFTSAFRSEIDLKAHRASSHSRSMGKQATKQARTLEVEFTLAPRRERVERNHRGSERPVRRAASPFLPNCNHAGACNCNREDTTGKLEAPPRPTVEACPVVEPRLNLNDFPSLGASSNSTPSMVHPGGSKGRGGAVMIRASAATRPPLSAENFPALSDSSPAPSHKVWLSVNSRVPQDRPTSAPTNFSIHVNRKQPNANSAQGTMQTLPNRNMRLRGPVQSRNTSELGDDNFPALKPLDSYRGTSAEQWVSTQVADAGHSQVRSKVSILSAAEAAQIINNKHLIQQGSSKPQLVTETDFPSLAPSSSSIQTSHKNVMAKKASSVTIPISNSWSHDARDNSPVKSSDSEPQSNVPSNSKSKKKKKKPKSANSVEMHPDNKKVLSEQIAANSNPLDSSKNKKKKQKQQSVPEQQVSKEKSKCPNGKVETNDTNSQNKTSVANQENQDPIPDTTQNSIGRKRSELQIGSLQINDQQNSVEDTTNRLLSILRGDNNSSKSATSSINPPPGFESPGEYVTSKPAMPPPGFSVKINSVVRPPCNQLTFTSSSGESYPIMPTSSSNQFVQPPDFQRRNAALMARVVDILRDPGRQEEFRQMSILFRQGQLSSEAYYKHCLELMGEKAFIDCFPEMLVLLPEINRQQDLLIVHKQYHKGKDFQPRFESCATCRQVLAPSDLRVHLSTHTLENHFPALSSTDSVQSSAWSRK